MLTVLQKNIKKQLERNKISVAELERRAGLRHAVMNIMHGRSKNPSIRVAQAIAKELGCSMEELLVEDEQQPLMHDVKIACDPKQGLDIVPWLPELLHEVFNTVLQKVTEKRLVPSYSQFMNWVSESYCYAAGSPHKATDKRFIEWLLEKAVS